MNNLAIKIENLSKYYRLGYVSSSTLRDDLSMWWANLRGKPNPLLTVGVNKKTDLIETDGDGYIWALKNLNLEIKQGEVLGIIGANGAGKSTLLKILSRITGPTEGTVKMNGRVGSLLEVGTGFHSELTGRENIYLNGSILGMSRKEIDRKLDEIIDFSDVEKYIDTPVKRYSSGMTVRLAFSVAAHLEPEILIVDEVLSVGDAAFQKKCIGKINAISGEGRTILFVSHNMNSIEALCQRVCLLENGQLSMDGSPGEVISNYLNSKKDSTDIIVHHKHKDFYWEGITNQNELLNLHVSDSIPINFAISTGPKNFFNVNLDFSVFNKKGDRIFLAESKYFYEKLDFEKNIRYELKYNIVHPRLSPGQYYLSVHVTTTKEGRIFFAEEIKGFYILSISDRDSKILFYDSKWMGYIIPKYEIIIENSSKDQETQTGQY